MIELRGLTVRYGAETAIDRLDAAFAAGTAYSIVGPSGCGKTSLLYSMAGLLSPSGGTVIVEGKPLAGLRRGTGLVTQKNTLLPWKSVLDNVALGLLARGTARREAEERATAWLEELGIVEHRRKLPCQLSGGQAQRAALARTLVTEPDILLLDEPTSQLDQISKEDAQDAMLAQFAKSRALTVLVTHSVEEAVFLGSRVLVMKAGGFAASFENPSYGREDARMREDFHEVAMSVRSALAEGRR